MTSRATLILLIGPVGAGKSTYAQHRIARSPAVFFNLDPWMTRLFGADPRPPAGLIAWYQERRDRCRAVIWDMAQKVLECGTDAIVEIGLLSALEREAFYEQVYSSEFNLEIILIDAPRDVRRKRVQNRNESPLPDTQIVPLPFFELASDAWEPPSESERRRWAIVER